MMKRLLTSLFAGALLVTSASVSFAAAPTIRDLPEVIIGDAEDNIGTDNNFFVFTNAFKFDDYAQDVDTTVSTLIWSFDEGNPTGPNWFEINGIGPVAVGDAAIAAEAAAGGVNRLNPAGKNIRLGNTFATFRDVIFSPPPTVLPYADPVDPAKTQHATGKTVRFYVSDGTQVTSEDTIVRTVDDGFDALSPACVYSTRQVDSFTTNNVTTNAGDPNGWFFSVAAGSPVGAYEAGTQSISIQVFSQPATNYATASYQTLIGDWLPYGFVGSDNVVRGKFYVFASGQSPNQANVIPNLRLKLQNFVIVASTLEVLHTNNAADDNFGAELAPSRTASAPSIYRVDYDPVDVPVLAANAGPSGLGGILRAFEAYALNPQNNGKLHLAESEIGTYPLATCTPFSVAPAKTYLPPDLANFDGTNYDAFRFFPLPPAGQFGSIDRTSGQIPTVTHSGSVGVTLSSVAMPSANLGVATADFSPFGKPAGSVTPADYAAMLRVEEGKQYSIRWHITSTRNSNVQSQIRLRARSARFNWNHKLEIGGSRASNNATAQLIATQTLPGIGCLNPDKKPGANGGWYHQIFHPHLNGDIRADVAGTLATKMPLQSAVPGPGSTSSDTRRALFIGVDLVDSLSPLSNSPELEAGLFTIDEVQIRVHPLVAD
ncbi:MAG: hypothetical protein N2111_01625 [Candidatus Sumerlaeaceae bacterium]|nr:hypothetical protein [Candidatus Sumerlaeaceae bacterium]